MAYAGHWDRKEIEAAFDSATKTLKFSGFQLVEKMKSVFPVWIVPCKNWKS